MIHVITGSLLKDGDFHYILNDTFGIQVEYSGTQKKGRYWLFPLLDDHNKTVSYFARDTNTQKSLFLKMLKMGGVGPKTAFTISLLDQKELQQAIETMNIAYFQKIQGIGPKTAKRLVIELKSVLKNDDLVRICGDDKAIKEIVRYCKGLGYDTEKVKEMLSSYDGSIKKENAGEAIKRLIGRL